MATYGQQKSYSRKPSQPKNSQAQGQGSSVGNKPEFESPDETEFPPLNLHFKNEAGEYDYVATVYPYFKKDKSVGYRTSSKANVNMFIDEVNVDKLFVLKDKDAEGNFNPVAALIPITTKNGKLMYVPLEGSAQPFYASPKKPKDQ